MNWSDLQPLLKTFRFAMPWLLLLLLLLLLTYAIWREWQKRRVRQPVAVRIYDDQNI